MQLRPRQEIFVQRSLDALLKYGNTLAIAATGFGKTIALSAIAGRFLTEGHGESVLVLQHREELLDQNSRKFGLVNPDVRYTLYNSKDKNCKGNVVFGMVQTLARPDNLKQDIKDYDLVIVDECHRIAADSYIEILDAVKARNNQMKTLGVTATPDRSDRKSLRKVFDNVADSVSIAELVRSGHLVKPITYGVELGITGALASIRIKGNDFDMEEAASILNKTVHNETAIKKWAELAGDRKTMEFCSTVQHAKDKAEAYRKMGYRAEAVYGDMPKEERARILGRFATSDLQVITNVAVATEGYDCPPISCVILSRPCSDINVVKQMVGRGLRTVNAEEYPGIVKSDCIIIDFGQSLEKHRSAIFEGDFVLEEDQDRRKKGEPSCKICPQCEAKLPVSTKICTFCYWMFLSEPDPEKEELKFFELKELTIFQSSPYQWESFWGDKVYIASAFDAWAICMKSKGQWHVMGANTKIGLHHVMVGDKLLALAAADDFLRQHGDKKNAKKTKEWLQKTASAKQCRLLGIEPLAAMDITRYRAGCMLQWKFNQLGVEQVLKDYYHTTKQAA